MPIMTMLISIAEYLEDHPNNKVTTGDFWSEKSPTGLSHIFSLGGKSWFTP